MGRHRMTDNSYIPRLYDFLDELGRRQDRQWFKENKTLFDDLRAAWIADVDRLILHCSQWWPEVKGQTGAGSVYRIYRDTRFSPDKSPYKTYFSATVSPRGRSSSAAHLPGYYIQAGPGRAGGATDNYEAAASGLYGGLWCPESHVLKKLRKAIVDNIDEFEEIINEPRLASLFPGWYGPRLKTIPKGYDRDHPQAELLRLKEYGKFMPCGREFFSDPAWPEKAAGHFEVLHPLLRFLEYSINEE